jgi:aminopeptidase
MPDPRFDQLAEVLITHSTKLAPGEHVLIEAFDIPEPMVVALVRRAREAGACPHVVLRSGVVMRSLIADSTDAQLDAWAAYDLERMKRMQAYIGLRGSHNVSELAGLPDATMQRYARRYQTPVHGEQRVKHTRWCVLRWPTPAMAQLAGQPTETSRTSTSACARWTTRR